MLFNSFNFFVFFVVIYCLYICLSHKLQNRFLLLASYFFYGMWDWRFLFLIIISTIIDYLCGLRIESAQNESTKKMFLWVSIIANLSILGFFKYFNFFLDSLTNLFQFLGLDIQSFSLTIILPIGISFYTFQSMSYTIDIYRQELKPTRKFLDFALFVAYFPQLVAGPIERARQLLPQIIEKRLITIEKFMLGCRLVLWGLFKKVVVADTLALYVDPVYRYAQHHSGLTLLVATFFFAFQIYCDFSGYSHMAIGFAKMMGIDLMENFKNPYFANNARDFWHRWHISLSTWLRDYVYIPLGGNRKGLLSNCKNIMITMLLGGLWHGANWTFVIWGFLHGIYLVIPRIMSRLFKKEERSQSAFVRYGKKGVTFVMILVTWVFFRSGSLSEAIYIINQIFTPTSEFFMGSWTILLQGFMSIAFVLAMEYRVRHVPHIDVLHIKSSVMQWAVAYTLIFGIVFFGVSAGEQFIYFQF